MQHVAAGARHSLFLGTNGQVTPILFAGVSCLGCRVSGVACGVGRVQRGGAGGRHSLFLGTSGEVKPIQFAEVSGVGFGV